MNLFSKKPFSLDHFLAKELVINVLDSPEYMTYLGIFDNYGQVLGHNRKLTIDSLEDSESNYRDSLETLATLNRYDVNDLTENQKITHKIAVFDTENDIKEFEEFRYHSYPFNQISGNHLGLVEFMTDTHPVRTEREASDYIERVRLFDEALSANLAWLEKQKELDIYAPIFVVDHVIKQLYELIGYEDKENPLMQIFIEKISSLDMDESTESRLISELSAVIESDVKP